MTATGLLGDAKPVAEWLFSEPRDLQAWQPNGHLTEVSITNAVLSLRAVGPDPILECRSPLDVRATPLQSVEIRLKADHDGTAELFWSNTSTGRYGGFAQEKATRFNVLGDRKWHTYRLLPFWQAEGRIVRLRLDVYDGTQFELAHIRIRDLGSTPASGDREFDVTQHPWQWFEPVADASASTQPSDGRPQTSRSGFWLSPALGIDASQNSFVSLRMSVNNGRQGRLFYATDQKSGWHSRSFRLQPDERPHTYNVDMLEAADWSGTIVALGLQPSDEVAAEARLLDIKVTDAPQGPAELQVLSFALEDALPRVGLTATLTALVSNTGSEAASNVVASLDLPRGVELAGGAVSRQTLGRMNFDQRATFRCNIRASAPFQGQVRLNLSADNASSVSATAPVSFWPRRTIPQTGYVPEPKPIRGPFEVGAYYFPGWKTASQWQALAQFPERHPVLGCYREGDPEVADWHIKWAVEHGITFFAYDWYWNRGARQLEHALHEGFFNARYRHLLKFCLLWANHNPSRSSSVEDCRDVTRFWIKHYFRRPEHLQFDGKPLVIIFSPDRLTEDLGSETVKRALAEMREECRRAGLKGLYLVACIGDAGGARRAADEGYDSITAYNWPGLGLTGEAKQGPFSTLVEGYQRQWEHLLKESRLPLNPLPVCGGWDSRPWHGENNLVRFGRTPELFREHLLDARHLLESGHYTTNGSRMLLIEAWNEWGEGSYIEPHAEFGFGYLDALRSTLTDGSAAHEDVTPSDAGLGPYDVPPAPPGRTDWDFTTPEQTWDNTMDLAELAVTNGLLRARTTGNDPAFFGPAMEAVAAEFETVHVRLRLSRVDGKSVESMAQLFWRTNRQAESETASARLPVKVDGVWHDYHIPVARNPRWRGTITRLRLDPATEAGILVEIDRLWLVR